MRAQDIIPVLLSIVVIILVAILEKQSKFLAAVTATMPIGAPLALWIVYASADGNPPAIAEFSRGMLLAIIPSLGFLVTVWLAARAEWKLVPMIVSGYAVWGILLGVLIGVKRLVGL